MVPVDARTGLTAAQVDDLRAALANGRKPKVMFTPAAGQIAGQFGQVVRLTDPEQTDEWVVVQFGRDELPFAPTDVVIPPRGAQSAKPTKKVATATRKVRAGRRRLLTLLLLGRALRRRLARRSFLCRCLLGGGLACRRLGQRDFSSPS